MNNKLKVREIYCPAHFGNTYEVALKNEMREILREAKFWGFNRYSDWFDTIDLYDLYSRKGRFYNMPEAVWERKFSHYEIAAELGFELGLAITPNHVFSDQVSKGVPAKTGDRVFGQLICPSDSKSRKIILNNCEHLFNDFKKKGLKLKSLEAGAYDYGGCLCEKCKPWILTFARLCKEIKDMAKSYFDSIEMNLIGWWWSEEEHQIFTEWAEKEAKDYFHSMAFHLPYGEYRYDIGKRPIPSSCKERAFVHISYGEESEPRDAYGHFGPTIAPERIEKTVNFLAQRKAEGFIAYCEGAHEDINKALLGGISSGKFKNAKEVLETYSERYFGANKSEWAEWIRQWGRPFTVNVKTARKEFEHLAKKAKKGWRFEQLKSKLKMFEAHHDVILEKKWNKARKAAAQRFWDEKEYLWRKIWGLGLTRHAFKFDASPPTWYDEYLKMLNKERTKISSELIKEA